ncbi:hypothetical protein [Flavobacterium aciduliphilum]|uniref:Uncharacterized protein n=1 Tax=Flavobacterium aciduliphilum TaxID=1101402 RepID=A0A328YIB8_9FLAO|nr:hypothetical protein [Flavobacterium aciduliphilum]RAR73858.1 hypothetical protein CLV55_103177 [Flavobacterium aciduliphilum]
MNVHLIRSVELDKGTFNNVLNLLQQFPGPFKFLANQEDLLDYSKEETIKKWEDKKGFETQVQYNAVFEPQPKFSYIEFPFFEKTKTWEQLFSECRQYRKTQKVSENDIVVLLTDIGNDKNWFGGVAPSMKDYFVQTSNWQHFFGHSIDVRFPIAYEVIIWIMRFYMFSDREDIMNGIHKKPIGCIMDFCQDKSQIILKMRTADVCESCMEKFIERDIPTLHSRQFFAILDGIRNSMTFRGRATLLQQPSRMEIRGVMKKIFFKDLGGLELPLNPKEKAVYLFFLRHVEGISISHLSDYKEELSQLYRQFSNQSDSNAIARSVEVLVNPLENNINEVISRINRKISAAVGDSLYDFYCITGARGNDKKIKLDRELIVYL